MFKLFLVGRMFPLMPSDFPPYYHPNILIRLDIWYWNTDISKTVEGNLAGYLGQNISGSSNGRWNKIFLHSVCVCLWTHAHRHGGIHEQGHPCVSFTPNRHYLPFFHQNPIISIKPKDLN